MLINLHPAVLAAVLLAINALAKPSKPCHRPPPGGQNRLTCDLASLSRIVPAEATVEKVAVVSQGDSYGEGAANVAYPLDPTDLPALCAVTVRVRSSSTSSYRFGLFLPDKWNSRFLVVGNGGFAGGINWLDMAAGPRSGMASLSTDTGHSSGTTETAWARNKPEMKTDWGWRALHGSTVLGKQLVRAYYGKGQPLTRSYYSGCSTGGRQGLKELQLFPDSFDGALIGAPAWYTSHLNTYVTQVGLYNLPVDDPKHLSLADMALIADEITAQCDGLDGVVDGIVSQPELCHPDLTRLLCTPFTNTSTPCLSPRQIATAHNVYSPWLAAADNRTLLYPGLTPSSEPQWWILLNGTEPSPFGVGYARDFLFDDASWDWHTFNDSVLAYAERTDPGGATADDYAALGRVRDRRGKVVLYHGLADGLVPTRGTEWYWNRTVAALGGRGVDEFMRMFLVPGMQHCFGTAVDAPWNFGAAFQSAALGSGVKSVPGFEDAQHDILQALVQWVEQGKPVDSVVATTWESPYNVTSGVKRQRPLCAWPKTAGWNGVGDVDDAASWSCA